MRPAKQGGFTLIELIVVISILGILAAFAVPKFIAIEDKARTSVIKALEGAIRSSSALAHALWIAEGDSASVSVSMEGTAIAMVNGYPTAAGIASALSNIPDSIDNSTAGTFFYTGAPTTATCRVTYAAAGVGGSPTITPLTAGC